MNTSQLDKSKIKMICDMIMERIQKVHISCFKDMDEPLFLISEQYPGLWMEHVYDSVLLANLEPEYLKVAKNAIYLFIDRQAANGQLPYRVSDGNRCKNGNANTFSQVQECVSFLTLALEVYKMNHDPAFLSKVYEAGKKWDNWFRTYRMTSGRGLIEMFVGYDTGHDNSGRLNGMACKGNYQINGETQNAAVLPANDITPILAVDMNCNFYGNQKALAEMAKILNRHDEAASWEESAKDVKKKLFEYCYDEKDAFFYDVDNANNKRKYRSSTIFHLFLEKVLDRDADQELIKRIYNEHIKNPDEFWTPFPFPSMAVNDASVEGHKDFNCWGYYTQGLIVLRCIRWMDYYHWNEDFDYICEKWLETWTEHFDDIKLAQEIDPITGVPTKSSEWYSSCMLAYIYAARRLGIV